MSERARVLRVIDVNRNRTLEALRVVEEHARFVAEDRGAARAAKALRHRLQQALDRPELREALAARDVAGDLGHPSVAPDTRPRTSAAEVLGANLSRAKEGLRALEEYAKVAAPAASVPLSECRYALYALEQQALAGPPSLAGREVYALLGGGAGRAPVAEQLEALLAGGVRLFQLREKALADRALLELAQALVARCAESDAWLIVNDRPDLAQLAGASGVHLGRDDLPAAAARRIVGPRQHVGASAHDRAELEAALDEGASYLGYGTLFASPTKPELGAQGLAGLSELARECPLPIYGIGGVTRANAAEVIAAGAHGVCVGSELLDAPDPEAAARELVAIVREAAS